ncbi:PAS domain S-box protein [Roseomonas populi]|uniref:PAS domain S-box protein n=1 Tax=Roseomonas populi TaxID=3121582 RepID=A0ABT1X9Z7_9PROT|nr:PAS domain S-box protein [Roseomonas pecuniae]MCR0984926.1 PAS domain S-box protein [Roseomonas pecuniae]
MNERLVSSSPNPTVFQEPSPQLAILPTVYDAIPVGLCLINKNLCFVSINRRLAEMTGRPAEVDIGRTLGEVVPSVAVQLEPHLRRALQGESVADLELQGTQIGGVCEGRVYLVSLEPARDKKGEIVGALCSALDITERKRAEEALREHREQLSNLVGQAAIGIAQTDLEGRFLLVNDRFCEIVGRDRKALLGRLMQDITHTDARPQNIALFRRLVETGEPFSIEKRYVRPDGSSVWVSNYVSATRDTSGHPQVAVAIVQDVTDAKRAETALRESEDHYRHVVELSPHIPWTAEPDGVTVEASSRWLALTGSTEPGGEGWANSVHPDDLAGASAAWSRSLKSGEPYDFEYRLRLADGNYCWVRSRAAPRRDAQGRITRWYGTVEDVHEHKLAEAALAEREAAFRLLFQSNPAPMWVYDRETLRFLEVNDAAIQVYGWSREDFLGMTILDIRPAQDHELVRRSAMEPRSARKVSGPWRHLDASGRDRLVDAISYVIEFAERPAVLVTAWDVTDRVHAEEALRESEENYRYTIELSPQIPWVADGDGQVIVTSPRWEQITGMRPEETLGMGWATVLHPDDVHHFKSSWMQSVSSGQPLDVEGRFRLEDGSYRWLRSRAAARRDKAGQIIRWYGTAEDVHERKLAEQQIAFMAYHDPLTDLANRRLFYLELDKALTRVHQGECLALHCIDLDHFKGVNDTLGHAAGDTLLQQAADRLRDCVPESSLVARIAGDEFAIIQTSIRGPDDAAALARRMNAVLDENYRIEDQSAVGGASIGIALVSTGQGASSAEVVRNADIALYRAKAEGRGTFRFFERAMDEAVHRKQRLRVGLRTALDRGELDLHFQPLVEIRTGEVTCLEALLRWRHPDWGMISPAEFIPVAEEAGQIMRMGEWALRTACWEASRWPDAVRVAVNLSPVQFRNPGLVQVVAGALADSGLATGRLELEITESILLQEDQSNLTILRELSRLGVRIALDDFGTGFSSLAYLLRFPFDKIKIDRSFVTGLPARKEAKAVIRAVVSMSRSLGLSVTAEGVETAEQLDALRQLGCQDAQGYLFSRPVPAAEVGALIDKLRRSDGLVA